MNATVNIHDMVVNGKLPARAHGGYSITYINSDNAVLCPDCATQTDDLDDPVVDCFVHWEGDDLYCDKCNTAIPSEYGDPEAEDS